MYGDLDPVKFVWATNLRNLRTKQTLRPKLGMLIVAFLEMRKMECLWFLKKEFFAINRAVICKIDWFKSRRTGGCLAFSEIRLSVCLFSELLPFFEGNLIWILWLKLLVWKLGIPLWISFSIFWVWFSKGSKDTCGMVNNPLKNEVKYSKQKLQFLGPGFFSFGIAQSKKVWRLKSVGSSICCEVGGADQWLRVEWF